MEVVGEVPCPGVEHGEDAEGAAYFRGLCRSPLRFTQRTE